MNNNLSERIDQLVLKSSEVLKSKHRKFNADIVDDQSMHALKSSALSFISMVYGQDNTYFNLYSGCTNGVSSYHSAVKSHGILTAIQEEINEGWIFNIKDIVSAEIFSDFLDMADHLLKKNYKDPAAVLVGSVLEEKLIQLCLKNEIDINIENKGKLMHKKSDQMNSDLCKQGVYNLLDQKSVTGWLDLRNKAGHGNYDDYSKDQVLLMMQGVTNFISRMSSHLN